MRLLLVTPPVQCIRYPIGRIEVRWAPPKKPICYRYEPFLFPSPPGLFPLLFASLTGTKGATLNGKFGSRFRARAGALSPELAREVEAGHRVARAKIGPSGLIRNYADALPWSNFGLSLSERRFEYNRRRKALTGCSSAAAFRPAKTGSRLTRTAGRRLKVGVGSTPWSEKRMRPAFVLLRRRFYGVRRYFCLT